MTQTTEELQDLAKDLFREVVKLTDGPQDAVELLIYLHVLIWTNQDAKAPASAMLDAYKEMFIGLIGEGPTIQ